MPCAIVRRARRLDVHVRPVMSKHHRPAPGIRISEVHGEPLFRQTDNQRTPLPHTTASDPWGNYTRETHVMKVAGSGGPPPISPHSTAA
jgi:hypothetical protein